MNWRNSPRGSTSIRHRIAYALGLNVIAEWMRDIGKLYSVVLYEETIRKGSDNMTKKIATQVHVIADESLGGIKREYVVGGGR